MVFGVEGVTDWLLQGRHRAFESGLPREGHFFMSAIGFKYR
jgi:hypothetical protein